MLKTELLEIIANGENSGIEFKRDDIRPEQLAKEIVALVNFQGGKVILGVDDDGSTLGITRSDTEEWVMNVIAEKVHPMILPFYEEITVNSGATVAVLTFPQGNSKPYVRRHNSAEEVFIRVGSTSRLATREQQMRLYEIGGMLHTEALPVSRTTSNVLDRMRIENYLTDVLNDPDIPANDQEWEHRLANLGLLTAPEGMATVAGLVLFGKQPRQYLGQAGLRVFVFNGLDKEYQAELDLILDAPLVARLDFSAGERRILDAGLVEKLLDAVGPFILQESEEIGEGLRRHKEYAFPIEAIREVLINALVHRDWTRSVDIEIGIYSDRLEVISPGGLQNSMTVEKMVAGQRTTRNNTIMGIMRDYGYVDFRGMGIRTRVIPLMRRQNNSEPVFEATEDYLKTVLYRKDKSGDS